MRILTGNLFIALLIMLFAFSFLLVTEELAHTKPIDEVLDENIKISKMPLSQNSFIVDKNGEIVSEIYNGENRVILSFNAIPTLAIDAFLAAEDQSFYEHPGFDMKGITRAFIVNFNDNSISQGGSTITQQLARNLYLTHDRSYERKLSELLYAIQIERKLSKDEIITLYLNAIYFQNGVYGIEAASQFYFNKPIDELSVAEIAFISSIPNHPEKFNPLTNIEHTHTRKEWILTKMLETEKIDEDTFEEALKEEITLNISNRIDKHPDYVTYVHHELEALISEQEGYKKRIDNASTDEAKHNITLELKQRAESVLEKGVIIETALDPEIQAQAVKSINDQLAQTSLQAATTIIDHHHHEIVAITGGTNYNKFDFHRGFQAYRQPGSSIKPLLVFAPYLNETNTTETSVVDASPFSKNGYSPQNYGGAVYGRVQMEQAFKHSYNTAAVRLLDTIGVETAFSYLDPFNFQRVQQSDYILSAALGGFTHGVSVLEMTQAYSTFATNGVYHSPKAIKQVVDLNGNVLYSWKPVHEEVWSKAANDEVKKMMKRVVTEGTGSRAAFSNSNYLGGKTGTTNDYNDLWFVGMTDRYTSALWIGYDQPRSINYNHIHLNLWRDYMSKID
ncbi:transglycosylase domain-containing protein [Evansella cellulosilytica]|uniref:Peptidoglycan glycosyltransferase n=1 Tax=Evansella cellulosilytica (strain ATCC 21833 / DSM 2522 / FERM P-1141 / JCM 9156 / N-4) TaxID=649639 RepID=E6TTJ1_EVAC2|nr:transglycosylase domain-containing protein [Evansella cellulosilytica]ADU29627.1 Peptidoglycan glycosyltransferase [Evansella cellulosilytica DSM 2522]